MTDDILQKNSGAQDNNNQDDSCDCGCCNGNCGNNCNCNSDSKEIDEKLLELENNWKRALADYKNLEKRNIEERELYFTYANTTLLLRILPVLDNLEMLEAHSTDVGLKLIIKEFKKTLTEEGVNEIDANGKEFDADLMEAIEMTETDNKSKEGKVVEVLTKGYLLKQKLLRPARVKVGKLKES